MFVLMQRRILQNAYKNFHLNNFGRFAAWAEFRFLPVLRINKSLFPFTAFLVQAGLASDALLNQKLVCWDSVLYIYDLLAYTAREMLGMNTDCTLNCCLLAALVIRSIAELLCRP